MTEEEINQRKIMSKEIRNIGDKISQSMGAVWQQIQVVSPEEARPICIRLINKLEKTSEPLINDLEETLCELEALDHLYTFEELIRGKKYTEEN